MTQDAFLGTWEMDTDQNQYENGTPPQSGTYIIENHQGGYLFTMIWTDVEGKSFTQNYEAIPDGQDHPFPNLDALTTTRIDERTLDTEAKKGGMVIAHGRRVLSEDGQTMHVYQSGKRPDGSAFTNTSLYRRKA